MVCEVEEVVYSAVMGLPLYLYLTYGALESNSDTCDECVYFYMGGTYRATPREALPFLLLCAFALVLHSLWCSLDPLAVNTSEATE